MWVTNTNTPYLWIAASESSLPSEYHKWTEIWKENEKTVKKENHRTRSEWRVRAESGERRKKERMKKKEKQITSNESFSKSNYICLKNQCSTAYIWASKFLWNKIYPNRNTNGIIWFGRQSLEIVSLNKKRERREAHTHKKKPTGTKITWKTCFMNELWIKYNNTFWMNRNFILSLFIL